MNYSEVNEIGKNIQGWLSRAESRYLYDAASRLKNKGVVVEIGSFKGKSTAYIGNGAKKSGIKKFYCVDPHIGDERLRVTRFGNYNSFEEFTENCRISKVDDIVIPIVDFSENAIKTFNEKIEFIFIDGDHLYDAVKLDFELWNPKLINGGIVCFHDINLVGVRKVVLDYVLNSTTFKNAGRAGSIVYAEKVEKNSALDRLNNKFVYFSLYGLAAKSIMLRITPLPVKKMIKTLLNK
jgi:MMP 1-O-methyltransferase